MAYTDKDRIPRLRPTPLTWVYVGFGVAVIILTIWGFSIAGQP